MTKEQQSVNKQRGNDNYAHTCGFKHDRRGSVVHPLVNGKPNRSADYNKKRCPVNDICCRAPSVSEALFVNLSELLRLFICFHAIRLANFVFTIHKQPILLYNLIL